MPHARHDLTQDASALNAASRLRVGRQATLWMLALAALTVLTVLALAWYLHRVEVQEEERRRGADAQWLEQSVQFHFRRLEDDLAQRARQIVIDGPQALQTPGQGESDTHPAGLLWRSPGVIQAQAWLAQPGDARTSAGDLQAWRADLAASADNARQLQLLQDTASHLRRASYIGPLHVSGTGTGTSDRVWLAVPSFDGTRLIGLYVVALSMSHALAALLPPWFTDQQQVRIVSDALPLPDSDAFDGPYQTAMNLPGADLRLEVLPKGSRTSPTPRIFFAVALVFLTGLLIALMALRRDFLKRQRVQQLAAEQQEKLEASERLVAVGEVASTLAHELNQPLGALISFANGLLNRLRAGTIDLVEMQPVVQRMAQLAERAGGVTQRVNAFARKRELHLEPLDLGTLVQRAAATAQEGQTMPITLRLPEQPVHVRGDALLLEHLVGNLCTNALDWAEKGTADAPQVQVRLQVDEVAGEARLGVADSGPGVSDAALPRLFDAFFSTKRGGMGMGLAICRSIAEAHHGRIEVGRDALLGGARFTAVLPLGSEA